MSNLEGELQQCVLCGSEELIPLERYSSAHLCQCLECHLVFSIQRPSSEQIELLQKRVKKKDRITYEAIRRYAYILDRFEHFRKTNRILDLDCSHGEFLEMAKKRGWEVYGTADTQEALETCEKKGLKMSGGAMNLSHFEDGFFDIVCSRNVLEHLIDPNTVLQKIHKILRSGGLVYVTTPNFNSILRYRLREKYSVISYPLRLVYYSNKTLKRLFRKNNFKILEIESTGVSLSKRKFATARTNVPQMEESEFIERGSEKKDSWVVRFQKRNLAPFVSFFSVGDFLKGWFIKP